MYSKFEYDGKLNPTFVEGEFQLPLSSIRAYINEPVKPRYYLFLFTLMFTHDRRQLCRPYTSMCASHLTCNLALGLQLSHLFMGLRLNRWNLNEMEILCTSIWYYFIKCRFVHVSAAGVTRPDRPGLDLSKQPPAVRLNKELGFILTYKLEV